MLHDWAGVVDRRGACRCNAHLGAGRARENGLLIKVSEEKVHNESSGQEVARVDRRFTRRTVLLENQDRTR